MDLVIDKLFTQLELESLRGEAPTPLYHQMYTLLKSRILDGSIAHSTQMPTEQQLAEAFNISRQWCRHRLRAVMVSNMGAFTTTALNQRLSG